MPYYAPIIAFNFIGKVLTYKGKNGRISKGLVVGETKHCFFVLRNDVVIKLVKAQTSFCFPSYLLMQKIKRELPLLEKADSQNIWVQGNYLIGTLLSRILKVS